MKSSPLLAIVPLLIFILVFLGAGIYFNDFYLLPSPIAALVGIIAAFILLKGSVEAKMSTFFAGCGDRKILSMCIIYLLAGAFATVSKAIGSVDVIVAYGLKMIPAAYIPAGFFLIAAFISIASGTSVGTIVALGAVAVGFADQGININFIGAALIGGAMLGDNLSLISDTTIAATQSLQCQMKDKFKVNLFIALPAALVTFIIYIVFAEHPSGSPITHPETTSQHLVLALPYIAVIILSLVGLDVFVVLVLGVLMSGVLGFYFSDLEVITFSKTIYDGFTGMQEIFLLSLLTGGLAAMVEQAGGIRYILKLVEKRITSYKTALLGVGCLTAIVDLATANNTISIIITGKIAKTVSDKFNIQPRDMASVLDIFSCVVQGLLPYGAQVLILIGLSHNKIHYLDLLSYSFYPFLLFLSTTLTILLKNHRNASHSATP
ncbi:Na+/H+ antiporter NhaC family protein [Riemerella columbina]|uniref:Na+/H+ antiporter NhaC family protein n=1 Tax=Riemerella columbina TaxID=103810 RepID=UPI000377F94E|nr:Na+/H+ antiporter NhaC family protein [Riemerella columbina]